jgi:transcriptional regulator with XRE-family HTH domain
MSEKPTLGAFLRLARNEKSLSLRAVEQATEISNAYLSQLENGKIQQPSPVILHKLSDLYEISYSDVMRLAGYPVLEDAVDTPSSFRLHSRLGPISEEEEESLVEYLEFLRARRRLGKP